MVIKKIRRHSLLININICDREREEIYTKLNTSFVHFLLWTKTVLLW